MAEADRDEKEWATTSWWKTDEPGQFTQHRADQTSCSIGDFHTGQQRLPESLVVVITDVCGKLIKSSVSVYCRLLAGRPAAAATAQWCYRYTAARQRNLFSLRRGAWAERIALRLNNLTHNESRLTRSCASLHYDRRSVRFFALAWRYIRIRRENKQIKFSLLSFSAGFRIPQKDSKSDAGVKKLQGIFMW